MSVEVIKSVMDFQPGDWIIASKPRFTYGGMGLFLFPNVREDFSYMDSPIRVHTVTPTHVIYDRGDNTDKKIISMYELKERSFVIADEAIVSLLIP